MLGVPEELGGATGERSAVTTVLVAEKLAHGDMGLATAILAPGGVATAISLWGDADQQSRYLEPFTGEDVPAAALAIMEPRPLFDPLELRDHRHAQAARAGCSTASSRWCPRAAQAELLLVAARTETGAPGLFLVEGGTDGLLERARPGDGRPRRRHRQA